MLHGQQRRDATLVPHPDDRAVTDMTELECQLLGLARELSGLDGLDLDDSLFDVGVHSLAVLELLYAIEEEYSVPVLDEVIADPLTVRWLAGLIAAAACGPHPVEGC